MANKHYSPLRYPVGETKLSPFIKQLFYENKLVSYDYIESYTRGAGAVFSLLLGELVANNQCIQTDEHSMLRCIN